MKKTIRFILALAMLLALTACGAGTKTAAEPAAETTVESAAEQEAAPAEPAPEVEKTDVNVFVLTGPTGIGAVNMWDKAEQGEGLENYHFTAVAAPTEIVAKISSGEADIAAVSTNLASTLYHKTSGGVVILAVNTLGVLNVLDNTGAEIDSMADLKGRRIVTTGQGANPEYIINYLLRESGLDPEKDVSIEFKADGSLKVAQFVSSHRLGEHKKMSLLVVTQDMRVVANVFLPWTKLSEIKSYAEAGDLLAGYVHQCGGVRAILYGNYDYTKEDDNRLSRLSLRMKQLQAPFLEVMHIGHSAFESGLLGEPETAFNEGSEEIFNAAKEKFGRTYDIREAGYVLPDGTMLDFSGRHELFGADDSAIRGSRTTDHREISKIAYKYDNDGNEIETGIETDRR